MAVTGSLREVRVAEQIGNNCLSLNRVQSVLLTSSDRLNLLRVTQPSTDS